MNLPDTLSRRVLDQFTRQAVPFSEAPSMRDEQALALISSAAEPNSNEATLDVACGPGLLVRHFARFVHTATGIDLTPAMLDRARQLCAESGVENVRLILGDATSLPFEDASFHVVTSRFAFHHFESPARVLREMLRVCRPRGRVVVCDAVSPEDSIGAELFDRVERLRDPSTVGFRPESALVALFAAEGLQPKVQRYRVPLELEALMRASFPRTDDAGAVRKMFEAQLAKDAMGVKPRMDRGRLLFSYPAVVVSATAP